MRVEKQIEPGLEQREDLIRIMDAAAEFLASCDKEADSQAVVVWRLWSAPNGGPVIGLGLQDAGFSVSRQFSPNQLIPANVREHRLIEIWNDVLQQRTHRQMQRVNELISQLED